MGSTIKPKIGRCFLCPPDSSEKPLTGKFFATKDGVTQDKKEAIDMKSFGLCGSHYWEQNAKKNQAKNKANGKQDKKNKTAKDLNIFFASQLLQVPEYCENNCGTSLDCLKHSKMKKAIIAHILPKRPVGGFPNVATHPKNRLFLCLECHGNFDSKGEDFATTMDCFEIMCERFMEFENLLSESDKQRLPFYFKDLLNIKY